MFKRFLLLFVISFFVCSCTPTYPKENLMEDVKKLVLKETGRNCEIYKFDSTVFLDMEMDDLTSTKSEVVNKAIKALQNAVLQ